MKDHASLTIGQEIYTGAIYLTDIRLVFVGYLLDIENKYMTEIMLEDINSLEKAKTFLLVPNALTLQTKDGLSRRMVVAKRDRWYQAIEEQIKIKNEILAANASV